MVTHIRRCHVCGGVTESESSAVHKCQHCGKHLAPFFYFDESKLDGLEIRGLYLSTWKSGDTQSPTGFNPIWGLSTYWESNEGQPRGYS